MILLFPVALVFGQKNAERKESYSKLKRSTQDELRTVLRDAESLKEASPQEALEKVKEALAISIAQSNLAGEAQCYTLLGDINMQIGEWKLALENYATAELKVSQSKVVSTEIMLNALMGIGNANLMLGNYQQALSSFKQVKNLTDAGEIRMIEADLKISEVHYQLGDYEEALRVLESWNRRSSKFDASTQIRVENQKARIFARTNQVEEANKRLQSAQNMLRSAPTEDLKKEEEISRSAKDEIAGVYNENKRIEEKIELLNSSIEYNLDAKNLGEVSKDKVDLGNTLIEKGETEAGLRELEEAAFIADTIGDPGKQANAYLSLADLYERRGNERLALNTFKKYSSAVARRDVKTEEKLAEKSGLIKTQRDIEEYSRYVTEESLAQALVFRQRLIIYGLVLIIMIIAVTSFFIYRSAQASKIANQMLALKSLRSQMNPHFIFNALNSVNHFVSLNDERAANRFLAEFSRLMRLVLENSQEDFIPLQKEEEIISLYLKLEHYRFRDKFDYEILIDDRINKESIEIPPMLIQPYIENAVWHGLRYKESKGFLSVKITQLDDQLHVVIEDNGIGRRRSAEIKTDNQKKHESTGLRNIRERLGIINKVYKTNYHVTIEDISEQGGTRVNLIVPITKSVVEHA